MDKHPLDEYDDLAKKAQQEFMEQALRDSSLVFQVFSTEHGKQLLDRWKEILLFQPSASRGDDLLTIGMTEGNKAFMRAILLAVKQHEESQ